MITRAPASAKARATPRPIPEVPPVTRTSLPAKSKLHRAMPWSPSAAWRQRATSARDSARPRRAPNVWAVCRPGEEPASPEALRSALRRAALDEQAVQGLEQGGIAEGLAEEAPAREGAAARGLAQVDAGARDEEHGRRGALGAEAAREVEAAEARHVDV